MRAVTCSLTPPTWSRAPRSAGSSWSSGEPLGQAREPRGQYHRPTQTADSACSSPPRVADLQGEVASLRGHRARCEHATLSLLRELLQLRACLQLQDTQLKRLQLETRRVAAAPEKEAVQVGRVPRPGGSISPEPEPHSAQAQHPDNPRGRAPRPRLHSARVSASQFPGPQQQNQMQALDKRYPPIPPTHRTGLGEGEGLWGSSCCCPASVGPSPGLWFPPMWRLARVSKSIRSSSPEGLVAGAREPGKGAEAWPSPHPEGCPACSWPPGGAPGRCASCVPGWWKSGRP